MVGDINGWRYSYMKRNFKKDFIEKLEKIMGIPASKRIKSEWDSGVVMGPNMSIVRGQRVANKFPILYGLYTRLLKLGWADDLQ